MYKVGITGGIGSGKSTICKIFELLGIPIYYADDQAKWLMQNDPLLIQQVKDAFGADSYNEKNELNRQKIAGIVFKDPQALEKLESFVHPAVHRHSNAWAEQQNSPYVLKEAALTFESDSWKYLDKVITVYAPEEVRIARVLKRDKTTEAAIRARMAQQMSEEEKMERADFVIYNDGEKLLIPQVLEVHTRLVNERISE